MSSFNYLEMDTGLQPLDDILKDKEKEITKLKKNLKELNENLIRAAEAGNVLLEEKSNLEEMLDNIQRENGKIVEDYEQEKYSLENKLEVMTKMKAQVESNLQEETNRWKTEFQRLEQQFRKKHSDEIVMIKSRLDDTASQLQQEKLMNSQRLSTIELKESQIEKLQKELKQMQTSLNDTLSSEVAELSNDNYELKLQVQELEMNEHELSQTVQQLKEMMEIAKNNEDNLRQAKEDAERETSSYYNNLELCREECRELQAELNILKLQPNDPNSRGNSLFAEVEDKRVQAEKNLISMKSKYNCMLRQSDQLKHYTMKLKMQISALLETRSRTIDQQHVRSLEESLSAARNDNAKLVQKLKAFQDKLTRRGDDLISGSSSSTGGQTGMVQFFKNELKEKNSELERITEELRLNELYLRMESKKVTSLQHDLYEQGKLLDVAKSARFKLQVEIDRLKMKCGEDVKVKAYQHKWKSEKIFPKESEKVSDKSPEHTENDKENEEPLSTKISCDKTSPKNFIEDKNSFEQSRNEPQKSGSVRKPLAEKEVSNEQYNIVNDKNDKVSIKTEYVYSDHVSSDTSGEVDVKKEVGVSEEAVPSAKIDSSGKIDINNLDAGNVTTAADCKQQ
uniref:protein Spindly-like n=1 Tax=Styela clava TaxID=7725 RepID=UPI00193A3415|nr:protein Spindly-like [Styela clava]